MGGAPIRAEITQRRLVVRGVVQGVGLGPYVYQLAHQHGVSGFVKNTAIGVVIELEGAGEAVCKFTKRLPHKGPPLMQIDAINCLDMDACGEEGFLILQSEAAEDAFAFIPADICVCDACLADTRDPANRRFEYPFTNCTNCRPRYSIIQDVPYDRAQTIIAEFVMCEQCRREYQDPADRRYNAQPNACPRCGR